MKLYDTISNAPEKAWLDDELATPRTVVDINNVRDYAVDYLEDKLGPTNRLDTIQEVADALDGTNGISPWPFAFYEWNAPYLGVTVGCDVTQTRMDNGHFMQIIHLFRTGFNNDYHYHGRAKLMLDPNGVLKGLTPPRMPKKMRGEYILEGEEEAKLGMFVAVYWPVIMANTFAHCKNVTERDHHVPRKVAKKRIKSGKPAGTSYKTLVIDGLTETLRTEGQIESQGFSKALHICRGHFVTYTPDKPLFGRVTGTFWKPMHVRGNSHRGRVKKSYRINAPTDTPSRERSTNE